LAVLNAPNEGTSKALRNALVRLGERCLGAAVAGIEELPSGLGSRRFFRLRFASGHPPSAVARVEGHAPAGSGPEPALEPLRSRLEAADLPVPALYGLDPASGIELLEDLGDVNLARAVAHAPSARIRELYTEACSFPPRLQRMRHPGPATDARRLDAALLTLKEERFLAHSLPTALGRAVRAGERQAVRDAFAAIEAEVAAAPRRLAHRDFQSSNLMLAPRAGGTTLVMIDLQGAFFAPPEYDLVCLLRDSYVELAEPLREELANTARAALPEPPDPGTFTRRFDALTLARKAKDHAFFVAAAQRGDERYLPFLGVTGRYLREAAARLAATDPRFAPCAELVATAALETAP